MLGLYTNSLSKRTSLVPLYSFPKPSTENSSFSLSAKGQDAAIFGRTNLFGLFDRTWEMQTVTNIDRVLLDKRQIIPELKKMMETQRGRVEGPARTVRS